MNPLKPFIIEKGYAILDGGLSSELETLGYDLNHPLWTARLIKDQPDALKTAHRLNLEAGADCIISASYQASIPGLEKHGYTHAEAVEILKKSYRIATEVCDEFANQPHRLKPVAAASIGPYGAYLADGSEYRGDYDLSIAELTAFHRERFDILAAESQLLAIETIPSYQEIVALRELVSQTDTAAWFSFSCKDEAYINDGTAIEEAVEAVADLPQIIAVGVNCIHPECISSLIKRIKTCCGSKEIVVYPNSGETFCSADKTWSDNDTSRGFKESVSEWYSLGARIIGGCCRTTADDIKDIRSVFDAKTSL